MNTLYYLQSGETGPVRVALSTGQAVARLQAGNPEQLIIRAIYEAERGDVRNLHERYARHYLRGDWFGAEVLDDLPIHLRAIDFDRNAQQRRLADAEKTTERRRASLELAQLRGAGSDRDEAIAAMRDLAR